MIPKVDPPKANPERLLSIIKDAFRGKVVLPEFQRSFVWTREDRDERLSFRVVEGFQTQEAYQAMWRDDFRAFLASRQHTILEEMRKRVKGE